MEKYGHIEEMEKILDNHNDKINELNKILKYLKDNKNDYDKLIEYYYSEQRENDLKDDNDNKIDNKLKRGVLSEDSIYNLISDYYQACVDMLEISTNFFKK